MLMIQWAKTYGLPYKLVHKHLASTGTAHAKWNHLIESTQPPIPIIPENIVVKLDPPALDSSPLVLLDNTLLFQRRLLPLSQTCKVTVVELTADRSGKLSFQLAECPPLHGLYIKLCLFRLLYPCLFSHTLCCLLFELTRVAFLGQGDLSARLLGKVADTVRFHAASGFAWNDGRGSEEDHASEIVALVTFADLNGDGEIGLVRENVSLNCRWIPVRASRGGRTRSIACACWCGCGRLGLL